MSAPQANFVGGVGGKKAVHVKWAGKTIALGTFPSAEADEKCAKAKALTRAWRSTMRPKPSRDWVIHELERLGVRVVSGRLGRKVGEDDEGHKKGGEPRQHSDPAAGMGWPGADADLNGMRQPPRRPSSLGLAYMNDDITRRGSLGSLGVMAGLDGTDLTIPPHRPYVGGASAAAHEASRADHYARQNEERRSLGLGMPGGSSLGGSSSMAQMGLSVNPNQHYEMLKLHHMNLLNEIQETTLMMNLYQQQQLQQQLQQHGGPSDQTSGLGNNDPQLAMMLSQQDQLGGGAGMDLYGGGGLAQRGSLGLGPAPAARTQGQQMQMMRQQQLQQASSTSPAGSANQEMLAKGQQEQAELEERLKQLKEDIARHQKEADGLQGAAKPTDEATPGEKRGREGDEADGAPEKRTKVEEDDGSSKGE